MGLSPHPAHPLAGAVLAAVAACATPGEAPPVAPPAFEGARSIALVRWTEEPDRRPRDPLDALGESLADLGVDVRLLEFGGRAGEAPLELERLRAWSEARVRAPARGGPPRAEGLGREAAEVVRGLGVEVVVLLHRFDDPLLPPLPDPTRPPDPFQRLEPAFREPPLGALTLVDREGNALSLAWGRPGSELEPSALANAAEAVNAVLGLLSGEPPDG